ncbi:hypothetical protein GT641_11765 [Clostridium sp. BIOML-A1]|uniref:hypothetical protein n=1 Tax=Clostridium sp. BIOML-A1 TaxID=2584627 RepID=UPI00136FB753|nr:hypothetical protein [Clostridium sp. BIOML-A1]MZH17925.1 hypothetical protein [Clostridium sp. BIOML-A1]
MAYKFTEKRNNIQEQTTYVLYMIVSSYFHKSICNSRTLETSLYLHYLEMPKSQQENLEKQVIRRSEQDLGEVMSVLSQMPAEMQGSGDLQYLYSEWKCFVDDRLFGHYTCYY